MAEELQRRIIVTKDQLTHRVTELANRINHDYDGMTLDVICLVNSALFFCADLVRQLTIPTRLHTLGFTNYPQGNESGEVRIATDITEPLFGCHILLLEGIVVSGRTPRYVVEMLSLRRPASIHLCALGIKPTLLTENLPLTYVAFELGNEVAVGYGIGSGIEKCLPYLIEK